MKSAIVAFLSTTILGSTALAASHSLQVGDSFQASGEGCLLKSVSIAPKAEWDTDALLSFQLVFGEHVTSEASLYQESVTQCPGRSDTCIVVSARDYGSDGYLVYTNYTFHLNDAGKPNQVEAVTFEESNGNAREAGRYTCKL